MKIRQIRNATLRIKNITADAVFVGGMAASVWLLAVAMKSIPMGTAYAVWTGVGAVGGFVAGIALFGESASALRIASAAMSKWSG